MFGPKMHVHEAPLALMGGLVGGLVGGGGTLAGFATLAGLSGTVLGAVGGTLLAKSMMPKKPKSISNQQDQAAKETPALPPATAMPATPMTPGASPQAPGILKPSDGIAPDIPQADRPQEPAEASPPTTEEIARGQLEKKRKGRLSTILTSPKSRLEEGEDQGFERLGG